MAIAFDNTDGVTDGVGGSSSYSWSHTNTGSNLVLLVMFYTFKSGDTTDHCTGVTYNGVSMSQLKSVGGDTSFRIHCYGLVAPATGANTVQINFDTTIETGYRSASYTGVAQTGLPDASTTTIASSGTGITCTLTTVADNCWTVMFVKTQGSSLVASTGATRRTGAGFNIGNFDSNAAITPAGSTSESATWTTSTNNLGVMVSIAPFVAAPATPPFIQQVIIT